MKKNQANQPSKTTSSGRVGRYTVGAAVAMLAGMGVFAVAGQSAPAADAAKLTSAGPAAAAQARSAAQGAARADTGSPFTAQQAGRTAAPATLPAGFAVVSNPASAKARLADFERMEMPADFVPASADGSTDNPPFARISLPEMSSGQRAIDLLGRELLPVAAWYGMSAEALTRLLLTDRSVHLDRKGRIMHIDEGTVAAGAGAEGATANAPATLVAGAVLPLDQTFKLHTKTDSTRVLFLNFKGQGQYPGFDLDKVPATYSDAERVLIQKVWQRVAEDFAAFDVDVTTEPPAVPLGKIGATVLITPQSSTAGGYAYLNSFTRFAAGAATAFCFPNNLANSEKPIGECVSHEAGHTLGLQHQGTASTAYYAGHGDGKTGWAPIMGVGYYKNLTQWSKGEYSGANNKEDAYAVMSRQGLKPRTDDVGNTMATAFPLASKSANGFANLSGGGVIEAPADTDMFSFVAGAGTLSLKVAAATLGANVDIALQLFDASGKLLASANPVAELDASLTATLALPGTYYLSVKGAGNGDPLKTGYSNYGSIGQYSISGTGALTLNAAPLVAVKTSVTAGNGPLPVAFSGTASTSPGVSVASYQWSFGDGSAMASGPSVSHTYAKAGTYEAVLKITDSRGQIASKGVRIVVTALTAK